MPGIHITSEVSTLEAVLVHTPGHEIEAVTPRTREDYLYDDIIGVEIAAREHARFVAVLERFSKVYQIADLLREVAEKKEARDFLVQKTMDVVPSDALAQRLSELPPAELVKLLIEGDEEIGGPIAKALNEIDYTLPPLPNLFFPRDIGMVIGSHAVVGSMRYGIRWTEELLIKALFKFHVALSNAGILYDGSEERRSNFTLEGGDVHVLREDLLVVGFSERSSPAAIDALCDEAFAKTKVKDVIVVVMPKIDTAIHLDMVFSQLDLEMCVVYPPCFVGPERFSVLHRKKGKEGVKEMPNFFAALRAVGLPLEPVFAGGDHRHTQDREQWASACNFLAVKPGVILSYARNEATLAELGKAGFKMIDSDDFLTRPKTKLGGKIAITFPGGELVRGGGGPRCMTLPLRRAAL